jgi:hypothetical protein
MAKRELRTLVAIALVSTMLFASIAAVSAGRGPVSTAGPIAANAGPAWAGGGPAPTNGPTVCPGTTPYSTAQVVINATGAVYPAGAPVTKTGNLYALNDPVSSSILVLATDAVVDGSGCHVTYATVGGFGNGTAVEVRNATNVTIEHMDLLGTYDYGVEVDDSSAVTVYNATADDALTAGLYAASVDDLNFTRDNASFSTDGVYLTDVDSALVWDNQAVQTGSIGLGAASVTGVDWIGNDARNAATYDAELDYGYGTVFSGNDLSGNPDGGNVGNSAFYDLQGSGELITSNNLTGVQQYGALFFYPVGAETFSDNLVTGGHTYGAELYESFYGPTNTLANNDFANFTTYGVYLYYAGSTNITGNNLSVNQTSTAAIGVYDYDAYENTYIAHNRFTGGLEYGLYLESDGGAVEAVANDLQNASDDAIYGYDTYGLTVSDNSLTVNATHVDAAIYLEYAVGATVVQGNDMTGGWAYGVEVLLGAGPLSFLNNDVRNVTGIGLYIYNDAGATTVLGNDFSGNDSTFNDNFDGVYVVYSVGDGSNLSNNRFVGAYYALYLDQVNGSVAIDDNVFANVSYYGVDVYDVYGNEAVVGNTFTTNASSVDEDAIYLSSVIGTLTVSGNTVHGAYDAIDAYESYGWATITNNQVFDPEDLGIGVESEGGLFLAYNTVTGNDSTFSAAATGIDLDECGGGLSTIVEANLLSGGLGTGIYSQYAYSPVTEIVDNSASGTVYEGVYNYDSYAPVTISGNDLANSKEYGIFDDYTANVTIQGNLLQGSNVSINASLVFGGLLIEGNNASHSKVALDLFTYYGENLAIVQANDFSNSGRAQANFSIASFIGNDFLGTPDLTLQNDQFPAFYHNDVDTSTGSVLNLTASRPVPGVYNAALPVAGNYWTGYTPTRCNYWCTPPYLVPSLLGSSGYYDMYPLGTAWTNYAITFNETGLPAGTMWSATIGGGLYTAVAPGGIAYYPQNVDPVLYDYAIPGVGAYTIVTPASGSFTASGTAQQIAVTFAAPAYAVDFTETGLAVGTTWYVNSTGSPSFTSAAFAITTAGSQTFTIGNASNGTYGFTVALDRTGFLTSSPVTSTFGVNGNPVTVSYTYVAVTYSVTFTQTGLGSGQSWTVTLGGTPMTSTGATISFTMANGSYPYTVTVPSGYSATPASGHATVSGGAVSNGIAISSTSSSSSGASNTEVYGLLAGLIVFAALAGVGWMLWARKGRGGTSAPAGSGTAPPPAGATGPAPLHPWSEGGSPPTNPPSGGN